MATIKQLAIKYRLKEGDSVYLNEVGVHTINRAIQRAHLVKQVRFGAGARYEGIHSVGSPRPVQRARLSIEVKGGTLSVNVDPSVADHFADRIHRGTQEHSVSGRRGSSRRYFSIIQKGNDLWERLKR